MDMEAQTSAELGRQMLARRLLTERLSAIGASDLESYIHARMYSDWLALGAERPSFHEYVIRELSK